ncbi:hypothetical protein RAMLITH_11310 [Ramlibacter sp. RBP-2]|uniref:Tandem-95 repeat protein n=1 Tax=Ramlibacter lithotrophicus TaxID=2606681 RepID=A0A7X6DFV6_9BURK|nr:Ig-like domain-containing protein [Ramlibacter lithotrophicus]NKE66410.1 hypothetical protein [Ramlibacter lithotrophicus]
MAITATERSQIVELTVLMFNAAPGAEYLSQIVSVYETNGRSLQTLAGILAGTSVYAALNPNTQTAEAFADAFLTPLGLQADSLARDFIISKMNAGVSKGAIVYEAYAALNSVPDSANNQYSAANAILNNKVAVATYYSVDRGIAATDLASLQTALSGVTADPASVTSAKAAIDATIDFTLMAAASSVDEGSSITVHLTNGTPNTEYVLRVDSAHASDVGSQLTMVTTDANGTAHATIAVNADRTTEGAETLTISVVGQASVSTTVTVNDTSMDNTAPAITAEASLAVNEGKSATFNLAAADAEGDAVTLSASAASGTVVDNGNGTFTYTPNAGFSGSDTITVTAADALGATSTQTIAVAVDPNDAPIAQAAGDAANEGGAAVSGQLVATDADTGDTLTFSLDAAVEGLTLNADGSYTFDPAANTAANALVYSDAPLAIVANYTVTDALGATSQNTLTITVTPKPLTFTLTKAGTTVQEGASQVYTVTASEAVTSATDVVFTLLPGDGAAGNTGTGNTNTADFATGSFNPLTATIAVGSSTATFTVTPVNDATTELPEAFTVQAQVAGTTLTLGGSTVDATTAGGVGQTFTLTTAIDTIPGLIGSANSAGTDGNDTIVALIDKVTAANTTLNALDSINGGLGTNAMTLNVVGNHVDAGLPAGVTVSNVQTINVRASGDLGDSAGDFDLSTISGLETVNVTLVDDLFAKAATTTNVNVSGATGAITTDGGKNVTVTDATADKGISVGATTGAAGAVTITDTNQGTGNISAKGSGAITVTASKQTTTGVDGKIDVVGGTDVSVTASATADNGAITVGTGTAPSGAVAVTSNLTGDGTATLDQGDVTVTGGTSVTVNSNLTINAKDQTAGAAHTFGDVLVNSNGKTTTVTVNQNYAETEFTKAAVAVVKELHTVTFKALTNGQTTTVDGLTFTASKDLTAAQVAQAFSNLTASDTQGPAGSTANGTFSGALSANFTSGAASGAVVVFTAIDESEVLALAAGAVDPTETVVAGTAASAAVTSANTITYGAVRVDGNATASISNVTVNGYGSADLGATGTDLNALTTLSLANSGGAATVATSATTLGLTLNKVTHAVTLTAPSLKTLNVTATGADSSTALTAAAVETLTVAGDKKATFTADLAALKSVTVTGSAGLTLSGAETDTLTSVNTSATTGTVTASIDASKATYTGGAGVDNVTLSSATVSKAVNTGAGNDMVTLASGTGTPAEAIVGGDGTDTLVMVVADAVAASTGATFETKIDGFERLSLSVPGAVSAVDLSNLDDINYVISAGTAGVNTLALSKFGANGTLELTADNAAGITASLADATGSADSFNLVLTSAGILAGGTVTVAGVESVAITSDDTNTTAHVNTLTLTAAAAKSVTVGGDAGLNLTLVGDAALTSVDASALTGALTINANSALALTVTGGSGADSLTATGSGDTLNGGAGNDTLTGADLTTLSGGAGNDIFVMNKPSNVNSYSTIADAASGDVIDLDAANGGTVVFTQSAIVLAGTAVFQDYANAAVNALGADADNAAWFQFGGNTYIVQSGRDHSGAGTPDFGNNVDAIIKLTGLVDLSVASYNQTNGTLEIA